MPKGKKSNGKKNVSAAAGDEEVPAAPAVPAVVDVGPPPPPPEALDSEVSGILLQVAGGDGAAVDPAAQAIAAKGTTTLHAVIPYILTACSSGNPASQFHALQLLVAISEGMGQMSEPYLVPALPVALNLAAARDEAVRQKAEETATVLGARLSGALAYILPMVFENMQQEKAWQTRCLTIKVLGNCSKTAAGAVAGCLPEIIPELTPAMTDTKKQVKSAAKACLSDCLSVIKNTDIIGILPDIVQCVLKPNEVPELMHKLAAVVFVQTVDAPTLSALVPLLIRGLREKATVTRRQTSVIIENMSKLVENPLEAAPFLPLLLPALEKATETMSDPEARAVCDRARQQLDRLHTAILTVGDVSKVDRAVVTQIIKVAAALGEVDEVFSLTLDYLSAILASFIDQSIADPIQWNTTITGSLTPFMDAAALAGALPAIHEEGTKLIKKIEEPEEEDDGAELLADCEFTLAYGTKILLHNTKLKLKRGMRYGLLGGNDSGKTTLMRSISQEQIEGFPPATELRTVFVEADILGELSHLTCTEYVLADERIQRDGISRESVREALSTNHFTDKMLDDGVMTLSGGWRMKLALARAMLLRADILLLDEPTNHLDVMNVKWVKDYLISLTDVTSIIVSHDSGLLDDVCSHVIQIANLKLHMFKGNLSSFVQKVPEARSYFELKASKTKFKFPQPGPLQGVKSKGKALMKMENVNYRYPCNEHYTIMGMTVQVSLSSRVGCVGPNGAGKSTMIKCLTGEVEPTDGTRWAHSSLRMAYVAQHAFHHIEMHLAKTPNEYIRWRYAGGDDKEAMNKVTMIVTEEEQALMDTPFEFSFTDSGGQVCRAKRVVEKLTGMRREIKKMLEYECKFKGLDMDANAFIDKNKLNKMGFEKHVMAVDQKIAMQSGLYIRPLTQSNVEQHLEDVGLAREFGTHYRMNALSGGQKVKVVIGAAMWNQPHVVILDEPTNYLDRDSLGALAQAITEYEGGVVIITHNDEFCRAICPERWVLEKQGDGIGRLNCEGDPDWMTNVMDKKDDAVEFKQAEEFTDASGNVHKVKEQKKEKLSRKEEKAMKKKIQKKIKDGETLDSDEEEFAVACGIST